MQLFKNLHKIYWGPFGRYRENAASDMSLQKWIGYLAPRSLVSWLPLAAPLFTGSWPKTEQVGGVQEPSRSRGTWTLMNYFCSGTPHWAAETLSGLHPSLTALPAHSCFLPLFQVFLPNKTFGLLSLCQPSASWKFQPVSPPKRPRFLWYIFISQKLLPGAHYHPWMSQ